MKYYGVYGKLVNIEDSIVSDYEKYFGQNMNEELLKNILLLHYKTENKMTMASSSDLTGVCQVILKDILYEAKERYNDSNDIMADDTDLFHDIDNNKTYEQRKEEAEEYQRIVAYVDENILVCE